MIADLQRRLFAIQDGFVIVIKPPTVQGLGQGGGFRMQVQDRSGIGLEELERRTQALIARANQTPGLVGVFHHLLASGAPQLYVDIDRPRRRSSTCPTSSPLQNVFQACRSISVRPMSNDFSYLGRAFQVTRRRIRCTGRQERPDQPQGALGLGRAGAARHAGQLPRDDRRLDGDAAQHLSGHLVQGSGAPGVSSITALRLMEGVAAETLGEGAGFEWTDIAFQERNAGNTAIYVFGIAVLFVFLFLAAQYESWSLPLAIILIVPLSILAALGGVLFRGMDNNILTQVAFVVLIGLAAKNAILIVEFARQREEAGDEPLHAGGRSLPAEAQAHPDDLARLHFGCGAARHRDRAGLGAQAGHRHGGRLRHDGVTLLGAFPDAGVLRDGQAHHPALLEEGARIGRAARWNARVSLHRKGNGALRPRFGACSGKGEGRNRNLAPA